MKFIFRHSKLDYQGHTKFSQQKRQDKKLEPSKHTRTKFDKEIKKKKKKGNVTLTKLGARGIKHH
jgi:hypothetical protein